MYRLRANLREDKGTRSIADIMPSERITAARDLVQGLTGHEAAKRLALDGTNELNSERPRTLAKIAMEVLAEPMFVLLLAACGIYVLLGDFREALALSASIVVIVVITLRSGSAAGSVQPARARDPRRHRAAHRRPRDRCR